MAAWYVHYAVLGQSGGGQMIQDVDMQFGKPWPMYSSGLGVMGDVTAEVKDGAADYHRARFHRDGRQGIVAVRIHFGGSGAAVADVSMHLDSGRGPAYDFEMLVWQDVGLGEDVVFRTPLGMLSRYVVPCGDHVVFEYPMELTTLTWGIELTLAPVLVET